MDENRLNKKKALLDKIYYEKGKQNTNFKLVILTPEGSKSKWRNYLDVSQDNSFIRETNNRGILCNEVVIDLDPLSDETPEMIKERYEQTITALNNDGLYYEAHFTGSRGYHIHLYFDELSSFGKDEREAIRAFIIGKYDGDKMKKSDNCLIAIEECEHFKTGKPKTLLVNRDGKNDLQPILKEMQEQQAEREKSNNSKNQAVIQKSSHEENGILYEQVFNGIKSSFAKWDGQKVEYIDEIITSDGTKIIPISDEILSSEMIKLANKAEEYGTEQELYDDLVKYIHNNVDVSPTFERIIAPLYIILSWTIDAFTTIPYIRALGDTGSGKSRCLEVVGGPCRKSCSIAGCITSAPLFRIINRWEPTIIIDEGDFTVSTEKSDVMKILNCGFERGKVVVKCEGNNMNKYDVRTFKTFGPKLLGTRSSFDDKALESRCLTEIMIETNRNDIPIVLSESFYQEQQILRNKLLMFRFRNKKRINPENAPSLGCENMDIEPRIKQATNAYMPLFNIFPEIKKEFDEFIYLHSKKLIEERAATLAGHIIRVILDLKDKGNLNISSLDICEILKIDLNWDKLSAQKIGVELRSLAIETKQKNMPEGNRRVIIWNEQLMQKLAKRYIPKIIDDTNATNNEELKLEDVEDVVADESSVATNKEGKDIQ